MHTLLASAGLKLRGKQFGGNALVEECLSGKLSKWIFRPHRQAKNTRVREKILSQLCTVIAKSHYC